MTTPRQLDSPFLLLIGGHEDRSSQSEIHRALVDLAGGSRARILVCTVATTDPAGYGETFVTMLRDLGAGRVQRLDIADRAAAGSAEVVDAIRGATAILFTGGDQRRITAVLAGTPAGAALQRRAAAGLLVAGTSAGAAAVGELMVTGSATPTVEPGMGWLPDVIVDQHFSERGRLHRLLDALAAHPGHAGVGIDENTAVLVRGRAVSVLGRGRVTVVPADGGPVVVLANGERLALPAPRRGGVGLN